MTCLLEIEQKRLSAVHALQWLETAHNENFDRLCRLAAAHFGVPTVLVSLVERDRQWFPGRVGFDASQTPIEQSFCRYTIQNSGVMVVNDAHLDPRFADTGLVTRPGGIRFYAGAPLRNQHGEVLGSFCLIDTVPRHMLPGEIAVLEDFAELVMGQIEQCQLMRYRDPVSSLPNLHQFLLDTQHVTVPDSQVRLMLVIRTQAVAGPADASVTSNLDAQHKRCDIAQCLRRRLDGIAELYHVSELDFCLLMTCERHRRDELIRVMLALITEPFIDQQVTVGLACCDDGENSAAALMGKAIHAVGMAVYRQVHWAAYDEAEDCAQRRALLLLNELSEALDSGDIYLEYQPRFSLQDGQLLSVEALIRWTHPLLGKIWPAEFIPLIESAGRISTVTRWVINRALTDLSGWIDKEVRLSLNLSPLDFADLDIAQTLQSACRQHGVEPARLEVEITEGEWIRADKRVIAQLSRIRELGVDVAIDDFGAGYSNFAYLHEIPANILKLDKSLVSDLESNPRNRIIARSVLHLASELGYRTVAEGVETFRCMSLVREYGCEEAQGYFLSRPLGLAKLKQQCQNIALTFIAQPSEAWGDDELINSAVFDDGTATEAA
jgi:EAL domain-containing protein (putative c-di-GMP-specific phosphodiesterase class I)